MTETPIEEQPVEEVAAEEAPAPGNCRWCGAYHESGADDPEDWFCTECERYQDAMICPTCGGLARVSLLPPDLVPAPVKPKKKGKE